MKGLLVREDCRELLNGRSTQVQSLRGGTVLITGGTGFLGTWLTEMLVSLNDDFGFGCKIILLSRNTDRFTFSCPHLANRKDIHLIRSDIRYFSDLPRETNWIIHAAATPDNRFHASRPVETMSTIVEGTANLIRLFDPLSHFHRMLYISSGYVYGSQPWDLAGVPETFEGAPAIGTPGSAYSEAKRCAETLCASARSEKHLPIVIARPFAFLGPYQSLDAPWAANNFLLDALLGRSIRIQGDGETLRSYMYGSDAAFWLLRILTSEELIHVCNVGSPHSISLKALAEMISEFITPSPEIRLHSAIHGNPPRTRFVPDVSIAEKKFGLRICVPLRLAIEKTIHWNQAQLKSAKDSQCK